MILSIQNNIILSQKETTILPKYQSFLDIDVTLRFTMILGDIHV